MVLLCEMEFMLLEADGITYNSEILASPVVPFILFWRGSGFPYEAKEVPP